MEVAFQPIFIEGQHDGSSKHVIERRDGFNPLNNPVVPQMDLQGGGVMVNSWKKYLEDNSRKRKEREDEFRMRGWKEARRANPGGFANPGGAFSSSLHMNVRQMGFGGEHVGIDDIDVDGGGLDTQMDSMERMDSNEQIAVNESTNENAVDSLGQALLSQASEPLPLSSSSTSTTSTSSSNLSASASASASTPTTTQPTTTTKAASSSSSSAPKSKGRSAAAKALGIMGLSSTVIENSGILGSGSASGSGSGSGTGGAGGSGAETQTPVGAGAASASQEASSSVRASLLSAAAPYTSSS